MTTQLHSAPFVHADETSVRSSKQALWVHVCTTARLTLLHVGRRDKATTKAGPLGTYTGTAEAHRRLSGHVIAIDEVQSQDQVGVTRLSQAPCRLIADRRGLVEEVPRNLDRGRTGLGQPASGGESRPVDPDALELVREPRRRVDFHTVVVDSPRDLASDPYRLDCVAGLEDEDPRGGRAGSPGPRR